MKRLLPRSILLASVCSLAALGQACDSATPTAPTGTILTISAIPSQIAINGTSQIIVIGRRPDGNPLNPGTEIFFSTSIGSITPTVAAVDDQGVVTATFRADGRSGTANVTASVSTSSGGGGGGGEEGEGGGPTTGIGSATVTVQVGQVAEDRPQLILSASPDTIFVNDFSEITVIARNADGSSVGAGQTVILTTTLGSLNPTRPVTDNAGTATSRLRAGAQPGDAEISAILGSSEPATTTVTIQDTVTSLAVIASPPSIPSAGGTIAIEAFAINSLGEPVPGRQVTFSSERGTFTGSGNVDFTDTQGRATATLEVTQQQLVGVSSFTVSARTGGGEGDFVSGSAEVDVEGQ